MYRFLLKIFMFNILWGSTVFAATPFTCDSNSYLFGSDLSASYSTAYKLDLKDGQIMSSENFGSHHINAIGYNVDDDFIYGFEFGTRQVVRVDAEYNIERFDIEGLPNEDFYIGDVSLDGVYFLAKRDYNWWYSKWYGKTVLEEIQRVDLATMELLEPLELNYDWTTKKIYSADFAVNPKDNKIYTVNALNNDLYRIDPETGNVEDLGNVGVTDTYSVISFFDMNGFYYFYKGDNKKLYKIDISNPSNINPRATEFSDISSSLITSGDGARCPNAPVEIVENDPVEKVGKTFECNANSYLFGSDQDADYANAYNMSLVDGNISLVQQIEGSHINAVGYNVKDNYIYGFEYGDLDSVFSKDKYFVVRIDADFNKERFKIEGLPDEAYYLGDVSFDGVYYLANRQQNYTSQGRRWRHRHGTDLAPGDQHRFRWRGGRDTRDNADVLLEIQRVDVDTMTLRPKLTLNYPDNIAKIVSADFAFSPKDHKLYTINAANNSLYRIDPDSGDVENLGNVGVDDTYSVISFFDTDGYFYFYKNDDKKVYRIDISNPANIDPTAHEFSDISSEMITSGDGARCPLAKVEEVKSKPFSCSQNAYLFNNSNPSLVSTINLTDGFTESVAQIPSRFVNGAGYNVKDNMIWGYDIQNHNVIKVDADFNVTAYEVDALPEGSYYAGDVSQEGILYLKKHDDSHLYKIDLNSGTPVYMGTIVLKNGDAVSTANFGDFAFSPKDNMLYGISEKDDTTYNHLYKIDPEDGQMVDLGEANPGVDVKYHTFVFDVDGNLYFYGVEGKIYRIKIGQGEYTATLFAQTDNQSAGGDGARCPNAKVDEPESERSICYAIDDTKNKLYSVYMQPGATELPLAENIALDFSDLSATEKKDLDGEGGAYNSADGLLYVFHESSYPLLYSVNPNNGKVAYITKFTTMKDNVVGASFYGGYFYVIAKTKDGDATLYKIAPSDWSIVSQLDVNGQTTDADALAINTDGKGYIILDNNKQVYEIDLKTAKTTYVTQISTNADAEGLSFAKDGNLYVENSEENHEDTDKLFKIDLQTGTLTAAAQIPPEDNIDIEALSCNTLAATSDDALKLVINNVTKSEGNSATTDFTFKVGFSKPAQEGASFWYTVTDGSDTNDTQYPGASLIDNDMASMSGCIEVSADGTTTEVYGNHKDSCLKIPVGATSVQLHVMVEGDTKIEPDERFFVDISSPTDAEIEDGRAEGIIVNDDTNISINAMTTGTGFDGNITTQVVGQAFSLTIKAYDAQNNAFIKDVNITKVTITDENNNNVYTWTGTLGTNINGIATLNNIIVNQAVKVATVKIDANYNGTVYQDIAAIDKFAIRPDRFVINIPSPNIAGATFTLQLQAVSAGSSVTPVANYNEEINTSFSMGYQEKLTNCKTGTLDLSSLTFNNGEVSKELNYPEVGKLDFNISEVKGHEFAFVDANDTPDDQRLIAEATLNDIVFKPAKVVVDWSLQNGDQLNNYTYFGNFDANPDAQNMAAQLDMNVSVLNAMGEVVENFTQGCYADDVTMNLHYRLEGEKDTEYIMHTQYMDMNGTIRSDVTALPVKLSMEGAFESEDSMVNVATNVMSFLPFSSMLPTSEGTSCSSAASTSTTPAVTEPTVEGTYEGYNMDSTLFEGGIGVKIAKFNFDRKTNEPRNPLKFQILDVNASFGDVPTEVSLTGSNEVNFLYARAHIPDQDIVGEAGDVNVFYEVYCKECDMSKYGLSGLAESKDSVFWYILNSVNETYADYEVPSDYNDIVTPAPGEIIASHTASLKDVSHNSNTQMHIEVNKSPTVARIKYKPKSYLIFNRFNASADRQAFTATFLPKEKVWGGRGNIGRTVDTAIAPKNNMNIIDW